MKFRDILQYIFSIFNLKDRFSVNKKLFVGEWITEELDPHLGLHLNGRWKDTCEVPGVYVFDVYTTSEKISCALWVPVVGSGWKGYEPKFHGGFELSKEEIIIWYDSYSNIKKKYELTKKNDVLVLELTVDRKKITFTKNTGDKIIDVEI